MNLETWRIRNWRLFTKIFLMSTVAVFVIIAGLLGFFLPLLESKLIHERTDNASHIVDAARSIAAHYHSLQLRGELSEPEARRLAVNTLRALRYNVNGYVWVHDLENRMVMHPLQPELEGHYLTRLADARGKPLFLTMNNLVRREGKGEVDYLWPRPGEQEPSRKVSYVSLFEPWQWVLGSGVYLDDVQDEISMLEARVITGALVTLLLSVVFSAYAAYRINRPLRQALFCAAAAMGHDTSVVEDKSHDETHQVLHTIERMVNDLKRSRDEAESASRMKGEFLANMSHEIRTPMNAIIGMTELTLETPLSPSQRENLEIIGSSAESLLGLLNDILDFSRIEAGRLLLEKVPFDLRNTVEGALDVVAPQAHGKGLELILDVARDLPEAFIGDPTRLRQVLINLLSNAVKFTAKGEVGLKVERAPSSGTDDGVMLLFTVSDTGIGIPADKLSLIFESFTQADGSTTRKYGGSGLGLAICRALVSMMGGDISVKSAVGVGSTFRFTARLGTCALQNREIRQAGIPRFGREVKILLAEDNPMNLKVSRLLLEMMGCQVVAVENGGDVVSAMKGERFDVVLMDIQMPVLDGLEATRVIRSGSERGIDQTTPVIAMTAHALKGYEKVCHEAGMNDFISKPVRAGELYNVILRNLPPAPGGGGVTPSAL
ncbi:integral membrane sensor hybrid histidine kinase [Geobacter metallireducens RCH3]|uniref:Sensory/regulatory protein RpfC n=2 Tax=Geobacter metallireducens TaxID=28232 RepID=Q39ZJ8_GEOMG|nr:sensor histidine kinase response regulator, Cache_2 and HAMP domain-containing [Geobacter metallireducens GS-15]EHP84919.1 integral membrane sensor hybrid histidine kinase [Geobacter metallireducens RCH3]